MMLEHGPRNRHCWSSWLAVVSLRCGSKLHTVNALAGSVYQHLEVTQRTFSPATDADTDEARECQS